MAGVLPLEDRAKGAYFAVGEAAFLEEVFLVEALAASWVHLSLEAVVVAGLLVYH